jgi:polysaccharide pyruvyl transferase WcaK-like protein
MDLRVMSTDPFGDRARADGFDNAEVVDLRPLRLALIEFPAAVLGALLRVARLPARFTRFTAVGRHLGDANVAVDLAGISFVDSRGVPNLIYNTLMSSLPLLHGTPTVKAAQAIGPCRKPLTRILASRVLKQTRWVGARGAKTLEHLRELGLENTEQVADLAFSMIEDADLPAGVLDRLPAGDFITVMPSIVVERLVDTDPGRYLDAMAAMIAELAAATNVPVVLAAHSYEPSLKRHRMNDRPTLLDLAERLSSNDQVVVIDTELTAGQLRSLISRSAFLVTSRFHAMISALATGTPVFVIGWSHKYREVLGDFGLERLGAGHDQLDDAVGLAESVFAEFADRSSISDAITLGLPDVEARSALNFVRIAENMR